MPGVCPYKRRGTATRREGLVKTGQKLEAGSCEPRNAKDGQEPSGAGEVHFQLLSSSLPKASVFWTLKWE
jgi:hypothetical protein